MFVTDPPLVVVIVPPLLQSDSCERDPSQKPLHVGRATRNCSSIVPRRTYIAVTVEY